MCVQSLDLGFCLSFSVYPLGASAFDRISTKAGASPSVRSPACLQQEAESPPGTPHTRGVAPSPALQCPAPPNPRPSMASGKGYASWSGPAAAPPLWSGISQWTRRHTGLPLEWAGSREREREGEWWCGRGSEERSQPRARTRESWGSAGGLGELRRQRHV